MKKRRHVAGILAVVALQALVGLGLVAAAPGVAEFGPAVQIAKAPALSINEQPALAASGRIAYVAFPDHGTGVIVFMRMTANGASAGPALALSTAGVTTQEPSLAASGRTVGLAWTVTTGSGANPAGQIWFRRSLDRGVSWRPARVLADVDSAANANIDLFADGASMYLAYEHNYGIYMRLSANRGRTWSAPFVVAEVAVSSPSSPDLSGDGSRLYLAYDQYVATRSGNVQRAFVRRSEDGGISWSAGVPVSPSSVRSAMPAIAGDGVQVVLTWFQGDGPNYKLAAARSLDGGATWSAPRIVSGPAPFDYDGTAALAGAPARGFHAVWSSAGVLRYARSARGVAWSRPRDLGATGTGWCSTALAFGSQRLFLAYPGAVDGVEGVMFRAAVVPVFAGRAADGR